MLDTARTLLCRSFISAAVISLCLCGSTPAQTSGLPGLEQQIRDRQHELGETQRRLEEARLRVEQLRESEKGGLERLEAYAEQVAAARRYLAQLDAQLAARAEEIVQVTRLSEQTAAEITDRKKRLSQRLTDIYKYGLLLRLQAVMTSNHVTDVLRRITSLRLVARADHKLAENLKALQARQAEERARLLAARTEMELLRQDRLRKQGMLEAAQRAESLMLSQVRAEKTMQEQLEHQLDSARQSLHRLISELERRRSEQSGATSFLELNKGKLSWPVRGKVITGFGSQVHPQYKTKTNSTGIDIQTRAGDLILAVAAGKVAYADQFMGYGLLVILDHGAGFYTLYGNLESIVPAVGTAVTLGSPIGHAKDYLHFEIRKQGQPVDPLNWLEP